jgi:hypothetical protein
MTAPAWPRLGRTRSTTQHPASSNGARRFDLNSEKCEQTTGYCGGRHPPNSVAPLVAWMGKWSALPS